MCFRFFSLKGYPNYLLRILNSFWKNQQHSCSCGICLFLYCGLLEKKAEFGVLSFKKFFFIPFRRSWPLHNLPILLGPESEGVGGVGKGRLRGSVVRGGMTDQGPSRDVYQLTLD